MTRIFKTSRILKIPGIGVDRVGNAVDNAHDPAILRLENLDTDIPPPQSAIEATKNAIGKDENNSYLPFIGQNSLRQAVTKRISRVNKEEYDSEKECIITIGAMSGIFTCFLALLEPNDEVIVTDPIYAGIINRIHLASGVPVFSPLIPSKDGWRLDIPSLQKAVSPRTRMIVISPGMPTGHILNKSEWEAVSEICIKNDLWLLYDGAMERILYDNTPLLHPATFPNMRERTITVGSSAKELRMIGWRVGWIVGPESIMDTIGLVSIANVVCQVGTSMAGVTAGLNDPEDGLKEALTIWERRKNLLLKELESLPIIPPHGGWSLLLNTEELGIPSEVASTRLLNEAKIATTPMTGWGENAKKYIRLVFSNEPEQRLIGIGEKMRKVLLC